MSHALPSHALPSHALPSHDYSLPMTSPDWRQSKPIISTYHLYHIIKKRKLNTYKPIYCRVLNNIEDTDWYYTCNYIQKYGLNNYYDEYFRQYGVNSNVHNVCAIEGVMDAIHTFNWLHKII